MTSYYSHPPGSYTQYVPVTNCVPTDFGSLGIIIVIIILLIIVGIIIWIYLRPGPGAVGGSTPTPVVITVTQVDDVVNQCHLLEIEGIPDGCVVTLHISATQPPMTAPVPAVTPNVNKTFNALDAAFDIALTADCNNGEVIGPLTISPPNPGGGDNAVCYNTDDIDAVVFGSTP